MAPDEITHKLGCLRPISDLKLTLEGNTLVVLALRRDLSSILGTIMYESIGNLTRHVTLVASYHYTLSLEGYAVKEVAELISQLFEAYGYSVTRVLRRRGVYSVVLEFDKV